MFTTHSLVCSFLRRLGAALGLAVFVATAQQPLGSAPEQPTKAKPIGDPISKKKKQAAKKKSPWISLSPGVSGHLQQLWLRDFRTSGNAAFTSPRPRLDWFLEARTLLSRLSDNSSWTLAMYAAPFREDRQTGDTFFGEFGTGKRGTHVRGHYWYLVPTYLWGSPEWEGWNLGVGLGFGQVSVKGFVDLPSGRTDTWTYYGMTGDRSRLQVLSLHLLRAGYADYNADPVFAYLIGNLQQPQVLDTLGRYMLARGYIRPGRGDYALLLLAAAAGNPGGLTPLEALTLTSLSRRPFRSRRKFARSFSVYYGFPLPFGLRVRYLAVLQQFHADKIRYSVADAHVHVFYPLKF